MATQITIQEILESCPDFMFRRARVSTIRGGDVILLPSNHHCRHVMTTRRPRKGPDAGMTKVVFKEDPNKEYQWPSDDRVYVLRLIPKNARKVYDRYRHLRPQG